MTIQSKFRTFHQTINLARLDENATLVEKRDRVLDTLRKHCSRKFDFFNQGSYEMGTGVVPIQGDYDIDVGIVFPDEALRPEPMTVKGWVHAAVHGHTKDVSWKEPCITVQYQHRDEPVYHVDLAVYLKARDGSLYLARGKQHADASQRSWERSDPQGLTKAIGGRLSGEDAAQFRRVVQCLKRWKDVHFSAEGNAAPVGIGLTILTHERFSPVKAGHPTPAYDDLTALRNVVGSIAGAFTAKSTIAGVSYRIVARVPVEPRDDVFARMTDQQTTELKGRVEKLKAWLDEAASSQATGPLRKAFGNDFPE